MLYQIVHLIGIYEHVLKRAFVPATAKGDNERTYASLKSCWRASAHLGVVFACLRMTELPRINGETTEMNGIQKGEEYGVITAPSIMLRQTYQVGAPVARPY